MIMAILLRILLWVYREDIPYLFKMDAWIRLKSSDISYYIFYIFFKKLFFAILINPVVLLKNLETNKI